MLLSVLGILYTAIFAKLLLFLTYLTITAFLGLNPLEVLKKSMHMLLTMAGCPIDALGLVIGIDPIIDMLATPIGVFGVLAAVLTVAKSEKLLNK